MTDSVRLERFGNAALVTIHRPDRMNALSRDTVASLGNIGRLLASDDNVRVIVLTGAGDKAFCAGADLKERKDMSEADVRQMLRMYRTELRWFSELSVPTVAAINGVAFGGGLEIALNCDLRVMAEHAQVGLTETSLGIIPGAGGTQRLPRIVGEARAKELILRAARLSASEALAIGLVNHVVPSQDNFLQSVLAWVEPIANGAPVALRAALKAVRVALEVPLAQGLELEFLAYEDCLKSSDRLEALAAFAEKRKPVFKGR